jgi:cell wall-associated NlpC family hydrolase
MLGVPYRYGGTSPGGFDCSGLVQFSYRQAGIQLPRTARQQYESAFPVALGMAQPGDLLFFRLNARVVSHVGIYLGDGRFIHATSEGKNVRVSSLDNSYWHRRLVRAGSVLPTASQSARQ